MVNYDASNCCGWRPKKKKNDFKKDLLRFPRNRSLLKRNGEEGHSVVFSIWMNSMGAPLSAMNATIMPSDGLLGGIKTSLF